MLKTGLLSVLAAWIALSAVAGAAWAQDGRAQVQPPRYASSWDEYQALKAEAKGGAKPSYQTLPDWSGVWRRRFVLGATAEQVKDIALTPRYRAAYDKKLANVKKGIEWDRLSWCLPVGMPRWLAEPLLREFIATPPETWLIHEQLQEIRRVYTDGRAHVSDASAIPLWQGDSIGFWDGDTLVIHANHLKAGEYFRGGPDFSFKASTVERMRKIDPNTIRTDVTIYDPDSLLRPLHLYYTYSKEEDPGVRVNFNSCQEGNNAVQTPDGSTSFVLPGEPGYRDPATFGIPEVAFDSLPK